MLDEPMSRAGDIYVGLMTGFATGIPCTLLGLLIDRWVRGKRDSEAAPQRGASEPSHGLTIRQAVEVRIRIAAGRNSGAEYMAFAISAAACIAYLFFRQEILTTALLFTFALVGLWTGVALHSLYRGYLRGMSWLLYLTGMLIFAVALVSVVVAAQAPRYAPNFFAQWQQYVEVHGIVGMARDGLASTWDVAWLVFHVGGVMMMFLAVRNAALSMLFYTVASGDSTLSEQSGWLSRWAARYGRRPLRGLMELLIFLVLAYWCVDGTAFVFLTQELPILVQEFLNRVLYGARGLPG
ncbi:hypothetical protein [Burkholderia pyrrocinia]|uniref:hypothetical protein n=1 Tax=Burkholderia pyrrocinia TaxID=60550 RepID=UPI00158E05BF|nr:hypothetical protein [Burkholderia pyrrocinia]